MTRLSCAHNILSVTTEHFRNAGRLRKECVVLWLAHRQPGATQVVEVYRPQQQARADQFWIPPEAMSALMTHLRENKLKLAAQVHSHPAQAFHSTADDHWAIIRHVGALSIVVPDFAAHIGAENFMEEAKFYQLSRDDRWLEVDNPIDVLEVIV